MEAVQKVSVVAALMRGRSADERGVAGLSSGWVERMEMVLGIILGRKLIKLLFELYASHRITSSKTHISLADRQYAKVAGVIRQCPSGVSVRLYSSQPMCAKFISYNFTFCMLSSNGIS